MMGRIASMFRGPKKTGLFLPNGTQLRIGDVISLEDEHEGISIMGVIQERNSELVLARGHGYDVLPDSGTIENIDRYRFIGSMK